MSGKFTPQVPKSLLDQEEFQLYDYPSEIGLLSCLMRTPALMSEVERQVSSDQFNLNYNKAIYEVMVGIYQHCTRNNWPVSFNRISLLTNAGSLSAWHHSIITSQQGVEHLLSLEQFAPTSSPEQMVGFMHGVSNANMRVRQFRLCREHMLRIADRTQSSDPRAAALHAESMFSQIAVGNDYSDEYRITHLGSQWAEFLDKALLNRTFGTAGLFNVYCPLFPFWMELMNGGFRRRGMTIVAARPKVGKSTLLLCIALTQALMGIPTLYMDSEMSREEMFSRALSSASGILEHRLIRGRFADEQVEWSAIQQWSVALQNAPLYYVNVAGKSADHIASMMRQFRNTFVGTQQLVAPHNGQTYTFSNPSTVLYDWLKLPDPGAGGGKGQRENEALGYYASALKDNAFKLDLPLVAGAQNNRGAIGVEGEDWETMAESFVAGSDRIAQFCTQLAILRNTTPTEEELIRARFPARENRQRSNALHFNQYLHIIYGRGSSEFRQGIPLHIDRGYARYTEMATQEVFDFMETHLRRARRRPQQAQQRGLPSNTTMRTVTDQANLGPTA